MPLRHPLLFGVILLATAPAFGAGPAISKCQDAAGKWHYGDTAAEACAKSKVTVINNQGIAKKEIAPPPTADEIRQREQQQALQQQAAEQAKQDELLLTTYANEADIGFIRDRKIAQIDAAIRASQETLTQLRAVQTRLEAQAAAETKANKAPSENTAAALERTRAQIAQHETGITQKRQEQDAIRARAESELQRYRAVKARRAPGATAKKP